MTEEYRYINGDAVERLDTGDAIILRDPTDPRVDQFRAWVGAGNTPLPAQTVTTYTDLQDKARTALHAIDWADKVQTAEAAQSKLDDLEVLLAAGQGKLDDLDTAIADLTAASTLAQMRQPLLDALDAVRVMFGGVLSGMGDERVLLQGLKDETVDNLRRTRALLQALAWTDSTDES